MTRGDSGRGGDLLNRQTAFAPRQTQRATQGVELFSAGNPPGSAPGLVPGATSPPAITTPLPK